MNIYENSKIIYIFLDQPASYVVGTCDCHGEDILFPSRNLAY